MIDIGQIVPAAQTIAAPRRAPSRMWRGHLQSAEYAWAVAFCIPYILVFLAFVAYPVAYALWIGSEPSLYRSLLSEPSYAMAVVNTAIYLGVAVNLKMFCALLLSGFFMRPGWWVKALLTIFLLPWAVPSQSAFISIHWMLNADYGLINNLLYHLFGMTGPDWLGSRWTALGCAIVAHIWKWLPFWTVILLAGRLAIPTEILDAAKVDGATGFRSFIYVSFPLLANLYLICTLLSTIFSLGEYNLIYFVTGGGPAHSTGVLATLSIRYAFVLAKPQLGVAAALSALPLLIPLIIILLRKFPTLQVQL